MSFLNRRVLALIGATAAAVASTAVMASPAQAATAGLANVSGTTVVFRALMGKANGVNITIKGRTVTLDDKVAIKAGKGCKAVKGDKTKVKCTTKKATKKLSIALGDKNDWVVNKTKVSMLADGGTGNDKLTGGSGNDELQGASGSDTLNGRGGNDKIDGGTGNDKLSGGAGNDELYGWTGNDRIVSGSGNDIVLGEGGSDYIWGDSGNDFLFGESIDFGSNSAADKVNGGTNSSKGDYCQIFAKGVAYSCELVDKAGSSASASAAADVDLDDVRARVAAFRD